MPLLNVVIPILWPTKSISDGRGSPDARVSAGVETLGGVGETRRLKDLSRGCTCRTPYH